MTDTLFQRVTWSWFACPSRWCCCDESAFRVCRGSAGCTRPGVRGPLATNRRGKGPLPVSGTPEDADVKRETSEIPPGEQPTVTMSHRDGYNRINVTS